MSNSLVIRIDCGHIYPDCYDELADYFKMVSDKWFWGFHDKEGNPHYHWLLCTDVTDNNMRQSIRARLHTKGNGAYQCKKLKDLDAYGSYVCFKHHTRGYEVHGFPDEQVEKWRDRGTEILESKLGKEAKKEKSPTSDPLALLFKEVGYYDWSETHEHNAKIFISFLRRHKSVGMYGRDKLIFRAWKDVSVTKWSIGEDQPGDLPDQLSRELFNRAKKQLADYQEELINSLR